MRNEVYMAGTGGQGVLLVGQLLMQTANAEGLQVSYFPIYTPEVRGGFTSCTLVIADGKVGSPVSGHPACMVLMDQFSVDTHLPRLREGGMALLNQTLVRRVPTEGQRLIWIPATDKAVELGSERITNMVMLGAYVTASGVVPLASVEEALKIVLPPRHHKLLDLNISGLRAGAELVASA
jgi:2-oxoglutarate ferredoxin oxidoreductase subunit gamma